MIYVNFNLHKVHILPPLRNGAHKTTLWGKGKSVSQAHAK